MGIRSHVAEREKEPVELEMETSQETETKREEKGCSRELERKIKENRLCSSEAKGDFVKN